MAAQSLAESSAPITDYDFARQHVADHALTAGAVGRVGLELEFHLVEFARPERRAAWPEVQALIAALPPLPCHSSVTVEPGGQLELSTPPGEGAAEAVRALQRDRAALVSALIEAGYGTAPLGADPARPPVRVNPGGRYAAMEEHYAGLGCAPAGRAMMAATAALQVNLEAGPESGWADRLELASSLGPVLTALSATSAYLGGERSGWVSMRQQAWLGIDGRSGPLPAGAPADAWAEYALRAPVMLVRDGGRYAAVTERISFAAWLTGEARFARRPTLADLDYHLTTLFPPIRPRGYLEIRCLDALPDRWWPAYAAITTTLLDDPVAADVAAEACAPVGDAWALAARDGLADPDLLTAARRCVEVAAERCPRELAAEVGAVAELVAAGRTPGDDLRHRIETTDPLTVLEEEARG
jgi:glutamate--cysteine ligase